MAMNIKTKMGRLRETKGIIKSLALKVTSQVMGTHGRTEAENFTLKLEMDELFCASFNVSFTQLTIMSSLTFCPPPISSSIFSVYLDEIKSDFCRKVAKTFFSF